MKLYSKRRLIKTDLEQLLQLTDNTRRYCGYMAEEEVKEFLARGRIYGVFCSEKLAAVEFCGRTGRGLCIDRMLVDLVGDGVDFSYIRVMDDEAECINILMSPKQLYPNHHCVVIHYRHINQLAELFTRNFELTALRGGLGNKPYLLIQCGMRDEIGDDYRFCVTSESKSLSQMLEQGYRAVGAMGNKLVLTLPMSINERNGCINAVKTEDCGA